VGLTAAEISNILVSNLQIPVAELRANLCEGFDSSKIVVSSDQSLRDKFVNFLTDNYATQRAKQFDQVQWPPIIHPRKVEFKRSSDKTGLNYFVFSGYEDEPDELDRAYGASSIKNLYDWNEILHHRVKKEDLVSMSDETKAITGSIELTLEQIIHEIGTNIDTYPVGHGRVYHMGLPRKTSYGGDDVFQRGFEIPPIWQTVFRDKLSYLYDVADQVDWRFYATPRGDVVFEIPFYDFDPKDFFKDDSDYDTRDRKDLQETYYNNYEQLFKQAYSGNYADNKGDLTSLSFDITNNGFDMIQYMTDPKFDYEKEFKIETHEQSSFSNTYSDNGILTACASKANIVPNFMVGPEAARNTKFGVYSGMAPILGFRPTISEAPAYIGTEDAAEYYAQISLNRMNANARNIGIDTVPKFGLMVNRPLFWEYRNYCGCIINVQHSISWKSSVATTVSLNTIRGWSGTYDEQGNPVFEHLGGERAYDISSLLRRNTINKKAD
jgi:hypothetical protein